MEKKMKGIHHITAIVGNPQENVDFYAGVLGLRMVKQTVNFDDPGTYHLYFGDEQGSPGSIITFFPWDGAHKGRIGGGQVGTTSYAVPEGSLSFWESRLKKFKVSFSRDERFGETSLVFNDPHGLQLELVERGSGKVNQWTAGDVTSDSAIKGFAGASLLSANPELTAQLLIDVMGLEQIGEDDEFIRFKSIADIGNIVDLKKEAVARGRMGVGTVHHIAWRADDDIDQLQWKEHLEKNSYPVTPVQDRNYFNAIYFREHGDILFEIATDPPGFSIDEAPEELGSNLKLPVQYETHREQLMQVLQPIEVRLLD
ncbi:ring-cleaving dioxygenase [Rossellomorea vietnamensis]|uniref:Ring-cleaving dioxygenase n=1 Tax=Rossellomorea vietnamensis TaxID=218284 RepID=A0A5D4KK20_9BACI|nr:ring-cleaving dioxygenase [Rossellomorea vietnamensis]TYR76633.1 ring-cleaving dioxygenase [Rossellomorea vietnamensis]